MKRVALCVTFVLGGGFWMSGCSSVKNMPSVSTINAGANACPAGVGGRPSYCCDSSGTPINPPTSQDCNVDTPGSQAIVGHLSNGAASAGGSATENQTAQKLVGAQKGMSTSQISAATAADLNNAVPELAARAPAAASADLHTLSADAPVTSAANTAGEALSGGALGSSSSVATTPGADLSQISGSGAARLTQQIAGYSSGSTGMGSSGGLLPNGAHETGFQFGNGLASGSEESTQGGANPNLSFHASEVAAMNGSDPNDYFTRINIGESLFKKVENRYRDTSIKWASALFGEPSRSTAAVHDHLK
jgi:hypothetical protein